MDKWMKFLIFLVAVAVFGLVIHAFGQGVNSVTVPSGKIGAFQIPYGSNVHGFTITIKEPLPDILCFEFGQTKASLRNGPVLYPNWYWTYVVDYSGTDGWSWMVQASQPGYWEFTVVSPDVLDFEYPLAPGEPMWVGIDALDNSGSPMAVTLKGGQVVGNPGAFCAPAENFWVKGAFVPLSSGTPMWSWL